MHLVRKIDGGAVASADAEEHSSFAPENDAMNDPWPLRGMATQIVLVAAGILGILVGLNYLFATETAVLSFNLGDATSPAMLFARTTGAAILALGVINILAAGDAGSPTLRAVIIGNIVAHAASLFGDFSQRVDGNPVLWITVVTNVAFVVAFGYLLASSRTR